MNSAEEMTDSEMCTESITTAEKKRISSETLITELPNTKRRQTSVSGISDPSSVTQLVNEPTITELAHKLARDLGFVQMAKEFLLSLQGAGAEHLLSLGIWHNQQLLNELEQYKLMPTMKEISQEDQQIEERMARILEHPSLKPLLGEKEDFAMTRVAIIILLAYWIDGDNEKETPEDMLSIDDQDASEDMGSYINLDESIIDDLVDHPYIEKIASKVESGSGLAIILDKLLKSVHQSRASSIHEDCKEHFKIVNMVWEDIQLVSLLLKRKHVAQTINRYFGVSKQQLRETLTPLIKEHPLMKDILQESKASSVRGALTILIGYLSAKNMILGFDDVMGRGGAVGIRSFKYSDTPYDMKVEHTSESGAFMETTSNPLDELMPDPSLVSQLLHDASFKDVTQQIQCDPSAVRFADFVLDCLTYNSDERYIPYYDLDKVFSFWRHASLIHLRRALKKSPKPKLFDLFKELSDGAEMLRIKERLNSIRKDNYWKTIDIGKSDFTLQMRLALSILIGYWSAVDVTLLAMPVLYYQLENPSKAHLLEDLSDVEVICYWADSNHDLEGLKNVLASKYAEDSPEFGSRFLAIENHQVLMVKEAADRDYDNTEAQITAILKGERCISISFSWFSESCGMLSKDFA